MSGLARLASVDPETATGTNKRFFDALEKSWGRVPNMAKVMASAPNVLSGYMALDGALAAGTLPKPLREQIAILVAEINACSYCLSAHTAIGKALGLSPAELAAARQGRSPNAQALAALLFAQAVLVRQGAIGEEEIRRVREAGFGDGQIAEIIASVALNVFTNLFNKAAAVEVDFPVVTAGAGEAAGSAVAAGHAGQGV